jgi:hypothetical protein
MSARYLSSQGTCELHLSREKNLAAGRELIIQAINNSHFLDAESTLVVIQ